MEAASIRGLGKSYRTAASVRTDISIQLDRYISQVEYQSLAVADSTQQR
jgi:hypothetical protein